MSHVTCPICHAKMPADWSEYPDYPFCSKRCRTIDLGRWLTGGYRVASEPTAEEPVADGSLPATTRTGYIDLAVIDLPAQVAFYRDALGFTVLHQNAKMAFLSADGVHHLIGLRAVGNPDAPKIKPTETGLYHLAILYPTREDLGAAARQLIDADAGFRMAEDHGVSNAVYFLDPENNGIELYWDRPRDAWPRDAEGRIDMNGGLLDLAELTTP